MIAFWIACKDVLLLLKDKKALLTLLVTPLALTLVLGLALGSLWSAETPPSRVLYLNEDEGEWGSFLFEEVFALPALDDRFILEEIQDKAEARDTVQRGGAVALIHIPDDFSPAVAGGEHTGISVWGDPGSTIRVQYLKAVVERYAAELSARRVIYETLGELNLPAWEMQEEVDLFMESINIDTVFEDGFDRTAAQSTVIEAMDYYAAGMGVMYLLFTAGAAAGMLVRERRDKTLARMLQSPVTRGQIIAGKFAGVFLMGALQFTIIILVTTFIFGVSWGDPAGVALLSAGTVCGATGIGMLIAVLAKTAQAAGTAGTFIALVMSALGGSMFPLFALPPLLQTLNKFTLNSWAMEGFMKLMFAGGGPGSVLIQAGVLTGAGIILSLVAANRLTKGAGS